MEIQLGLMDGPPASITSETVSVSITGSGCQESIQYKLKMLTSKHKRLHIDNVQLQWVYSLQSVVLFAQSNSVTITAQFSEPMTESPTISISGQISNATMSLVSDID